ncbi:hypothetical protein MPC4_450014 [Methylocella tundrae]|uniref:Uncharacterized protein n=1 Tax=Methylocella tundrae TaxID=227605 RepID=A0A8B6M9I4_METTU|nr:hypothetical protein MPC4_450014 [Methylocella tundrae]
MASVDHDLPRTSANTINSLARRYEQLSGMMSVVTASIC